MMPGCLIVLNFRNAFLASANRDRCALVSKANMLHLELSSYQMLAHRDLHCYLKQRTLLVP